MVYFENFFVAILVILVVFLGLFFIFFHLARWYVQWEINNEKIERRLTNEKYWESKGLKKFIFETEKGPVEIYAINNRNAFRKFINAGFTEKIPKNVN